LARIFLSIFCILSFVVNANAKLEQTNTEHVLFIYPVDKGFPFWDAQVDFAQAVADVLGFNLDVAYPPESMRNRFRAAEFIENRINASPQKPSLVLTSFWVGSEEEILLLLQKHDIALISINSDVSLQQSKSIGKPREKYPNWLAQLSPNDFLVGKDLGTALIKQGRNNKCPNQACNINLFAITGQSFADVSKQRLAGLEEAVKADGNSQILGFVYGDWSKQRVAQITPTIVKRHTSIDAFWLASDIMAYGLLEGLETSKMSIPKHSVIGSIDWSNETPSLIEQNKLTMSMGGHFLEAGFSLVLYYDYLNGIDFSDELGLVIKTPMSHIHKNNAQVFGDFLHSPQWSKEAIKSMSKVLNGKTSAYDLRPETFILKHINHKKE
jgi:ABC-type sugar transport system substrate-binding protein